MHVEDGEYREIGGVRTFLHASGKGSPVVLLHGLGGTSYCWRFVLPMLARRHAVLAVDLPGFGRSDKPEDFGYSPHDFSRWLIALLDSIGAEEAALVGNSMGGVIALRAALEHPARVRRLALLGSPVYPHNRPALVWPMRWPVVGRLYEALLGPWLVRPIARTAFWDPELVTDDMVAEYGLALREPGGRRAAASFIRAAIPPDVDAWIARYPDLVPPVLVVRGEHDAVVDAASVLRFCAQAPRAQLLSLPECGHAPQEEKPEVLTAALLDFLK